MQNKWQAILASEFQQPYYQKLQTFVNEEYQSQTIYPKKENIFVARKTTKVNPIGR